MVGGVRGHMRQRGKGTWELRAFVGRDPVTGRDRYKTKTVKGGRRVAEEALAAFVTQVGAGVATESTFAELAERWFAVASVAKDWSPKTIAETRRIMDRRLGRLWPLRLDKVRTSALDNFYAALRAHGGRCGHQPRQDHGRDLCELGAPLSAATVRRVHGVVHATLEQAVAWEWIVMNPASRASPGRVDPAEIKPPTVDEVLALFRAAEKDDLDLAVFLVVAAVTGTRRGELCALRWTDVDLDNGPREETSMSDDTTTGPGGPGTTTSARAWPTAPTPRAPPGQPGRADRPRPPLLRDQGPGPARRLGGPAAPDPRRGALAGVLRLGMTA